MSAEALERYVSMANACILAAPSDGTWIFDLRGNTGGNEEILLASAAPALSAGPLYAWVNGKGVVQKVDLTPRGKRTAGTIWKERALQLEHFRGKVVLWADSSCASSCEMLIAASQVRAHGIFVGEPTAGLTTANESYRVNRELTLQLTAGSMLDADGAAIEGSLLPRLLVTSQTAADLVKELRQAGIL